MVINGKTVIPKVLHNIVNLIGIMLRKIISDSLNELIILNLLGQTNRIINGRTNKTNGNHPKGIGGLETNGEDLNSGLTKILLLHNYHPESNNLTNATTYTYWTLKLDTVVFLKCGNTSTSHYIQDC